MSRMQHILYEERLEELIYEQEIEEKIFEAEHPEELERGVGACEGITTSTFSKECVKCDKYGRHLIYEDENGNRFIANLN